MHKKLPLTAVKINVLGKGHTSEFSPKIQKFALYLFWLGFGSSPLLLAAKR